jgi:hypothetical protein
MKRQKRRPAADKTPVRILIDTCVWLDLAKDQKEQPLISALEDLCGAGEIQLIVPRLVRDEFGRNKRRVVEDAKKSISSTLKRAADVMQKYGDPKKRGRAIGEITDIDFHVNSLSDDALDSVRRIEVLFASAVNVETSEDAKLRAAQRAMDKRAPFHKNKNTFADAILIEIYAELVAAGKPGRLCFITHNKHDFSAVGEDERLPHADIASLFSRIKSRYFIRLADALKTVRPLHFAEAMEMEYLPEPRRASEISAVIDELVTKVWYNRHKVREEAIADGRIKLVEKETFPVKDHNTRPIQRDTWEGALKAAKRVEKEIGLENLGPWDDFEWGMLNGKLSALRWVFGDDWDMLDT